MQENRVFGLTEGNMIDKTHRRRDEGRLSLSSRDVASFLTFVAQRPSFSHHNTHQQ
jgi:hypothetical protein